MKVFSLLIVFVLCFFTTDEGEVRAAHILEPLGTEIAATAPRGRVFGQIVYEYKRTENGIDQSTHLLPVEFEIGLGERTQLNLEAELLLRENQTGDAGRKNGIEEIGIGVKHRFIDETRLLPDMAFEAEFAPAVGLEGDERGLKGVLIASKNIHPRFVIHANAAYEIETDTGGESKGNWFYNFSPVIRAIPDRLMVLAEFNGKTKGSGNTELTLGPEIIAVFQTDTFLALQNMAFKLALPFGLNEHSPDFGVKLGISKLF